VRMITYNADDFDLGHIFAELTFLSGDKDREMIVLMCDDRPVGFCFYDHRIILSTGIDLHDSLVKGIVRHWVEDLNGGEDAITPEYQRPDELEGLVYGYLAALARPRQIMMGADIGPNGLVEIAFRNDIRLLFDDSQLLAAAVPGQRIFVSTAAPPRSREQVTSWVRSRKDDTVHLEHRPLADLVDKHIA
jgi:hypothetical protein